MCQRHKFLIVNLKNPTYLHFIYYTRYATICHVRRNELRNDT